MDWIGLRQALSALRAHRGMPDAVLARRANINRQTVSRIEGVEADPTYEPKLSTIETWLQACDAGPVSDFIRPYETPRPIDVALAPALLHHARDVPYTAPPQPSDTGSTGIAHDGQSDLIAALRTRLATEPDFLTALAGALASVFAESLRSRAQPVATPPDAPDPRA